jgi:hypothetical protein
MPSQRTRRKARISRAGRPRGAAENVEQAVNLGGRGRRPIVTMGFGGRVPGPSLSEEVRPTATWANSGLSAEVLA